MLEVELSHVGEVALCVKRPKSSPQGKGYENQYILCLLPETHTASERPDTS